MVYNISIKHGYKTERFTRIDALDGTINPYIRNTILRVFGTVNALVDDSMCIKTYIYEITVRFN